MTLSCAVTSTSMVLAPAARASAPLAVPLVTAVNAPLPPTRTPTVACASVTVGVTVIDAVAFGTLAV